MTKRGSPATACQVRCVRVTNRDQENGQSPSSRPHGPPIPYSTQPASAWTQSCTEQPIRRGRDGSPAAGPRPAAEAAGSGIVRLYDDFVDIEYDWGTSSPGCPPWISRSCTGDLAKHLSKELVCASRAA